MQERGLKVPLPLFLWVPASFRFKTINKFIRNHYPDDPEAQAGHFSTFFYLHTHPPLSVRLK